MRRTALSIVFLAACLVAGPALAYSPQIDFRNQSIWGGADDQASFSGSQNGVDIILSAQPSSAKLYWDATDGIGVQYSYENDEIESAERLHVVFGSQTQLSAIYVSDLFIEDSYAEIGSYRIKDGTWHDWEMFDATLPGSGSNGEHVLAFDPALVITELKFKAPGRTNGQDHEFSLMGFDAVPDPVGATGPPTGGAPVPEPSSFAMFCVGGLTVAASRRRRKA